MNSNLQTDISAQVVLKAARLTSPDNIANEFEHADFRVSPLVANSFSITGPLDLFEQYFGVRLVVTARGEIQISGKSGPARYELPLDRLSANTRENVQAIVFTPMPDFGAGGNP